MEESARETEEHERYRPLVEAALAAKGEVTTERICEVTTARVDEMYARFVREARTRAFEQEVAMKVAEERRRWRPLVKAMQDTERAIDSTLRHLDIREEMADVHAADKVRRILEEIRTMEACIEDFRDR